MTDATTFDAPPDDPRRAARRNPLLVYFLLGAYLGFVFVRSEVASWFRIQEMFRFQAFHMYGIIGTAVLVAMVSVAIMRRTGARSFSGEVITFGDPDGGRPRVQHVLGGTAFGLGWGLLGACPGPIYALIGTGLSVMTVGLLSALAGAWVYGLLKPRLPHG
jgi:uncharacterized membrane protein YedE/YeeE